MFLRSIYRVLKRLGRGNADELGGLFHGREAITYWEACRLYSSMKNRTDIPWDYRENCCHARAHYMCNLISSSGLRVKKVWAFASYDQNLRPSGRTLRLTVNGQTIRWRYHVAPVIRVRRFIKEDLFVIDPSVSDKCPLKLNDWLASMDDESASVEFTASETLFFDPADGMRAMCDLQDLDGVFQSLAEHFNDLEKSYGMV